MIKKEYLVNRFDNSGDWLDCFFIWVSGKNQGEIDLKLGAFHEEEIKKEYVEDIDIQLISVIPYSENAVKLGFFA